MSSVRMRVASRDWWASRRMVSVTVIFLLMVFSPLQARVGGNGGGDGQGQFARLAFDRVVQQLRVLVDEAGVEAAAAEVGIGENLLVIGGGGLHPLQTHVIQGARAARNGFLP